MKSRNRAKGQSLVELAAGLMVFIPMILLLIDCSVIMIGVSVNEAACRDAARAASSGSSPSTSSAGTHTVVPSSIPYQRAVAVIKNMYSGAGLVSISTTLAMTESLNSPTVSGAPLTGEVSVETTASVTPPFLIRVFVENGAYTFKSSQSYPYTYVAPAP